MNLRGVVSGGLILFTAIYLISSCVSPKRAGDRSRSELRTVKGRVEAAQVTSFMYGSHILYDDSGERMYALTSNTVKLSQFEGQNIQLRGKLKEGYPVDNGPPYLEVISVER